MPVSKITPAQWAEIVTAFQRGEKNMVQLGEEYGVDYKTISRGLRTRGVSRNSKLTEHAQDDDAELARKEREEMAARAKKKQETYSKYNDAIVQMMMKRLVQGDKDGNNIATYAKEIRVLKDASQILERARRENWEILRIEDLLGESESMPDLNVGEYTPEEIEEIRRANEEHYLEEQSHEDEDEYDLELTDEEDDDEP